MKAAFHFQFLQIQFRNCRVAKRKVGMILQQWFAQKFIPNHIASLFCFRSSRYWRKSGESRDDAKIRYETKTVTDHLNRLARQAHNQITLEITGPVSGRIK